MTGAMSTRDDVDGKLTGHPTSPDREREDVMLGTIIGDVIGSPFKGAAINQREFPLYSERNTFTQATVCTIAFMDALTSNRSAAECLRDWVIRYPERGYDSKLLNWATTHNTEPYQSLSDNPATRIAPAALRAATTEMALRLTEQFISDSNNAPESRLNATAIAHACFMALAGETRDCIRNRISRTYGYDLSDNVAALASPTSKDQVNKSSTAAALIAALEANSYEEAIRNAVILGGRTDNLCAMTGGLAECLYGLPDRIYGPALKLLPSEMLRMIDSFYQCCGKDIWPIDPKPRMRHPARSRKLYHWLLGLGRICQVIR